MDHVVARFCPTGNLAVNTQNININRIIILIFAVLPSAFIQSAYKSLLQMSLVFPDVIINIIKCSAERQVLWFYLKISLSIFLMPSIISSPLNHLWTSSKTSGSIQFFLVSACSLVSLVLSKSLDFFQFVELFSSPDRFISSILFVPFFNRWHIQLFVCTTQQSSAYVVTHLFVFLNVSPATHCRLHFFIIASVFPRLFYSTYLSAIFPASLSYMILEYIYYVENIFVRHYV